MELPTLAEVEVQLVKEFGLHEFIKLAWPIVEPSTPFIDNWHIQAMAEHVQALYEGDIQRLLINIPPRTLKSLTCSVFAPAWIWTKRPDMKMIFASYSGSLSMGDSVKTRRLIESPWYQQRWGHVYNLSQDQNTKTEFENNKKGSRVATSVGGKVTGLGAEVITCDDLLDKARSESQAYRTEASNFYWETLPSRFNDRSKGRLLNIQQRLHPQDQTGEILERERNGKVETYEKLILPMEYVPTTYVTVLGFRDPRTVEGESLHPERFSEHTIKGLKDDLGSYAYAGQYAQTPVPREGGMIKEEWLQHYFECDLIPELLMRREPLLVVQSADCASKPKQRNDPTVWGTWAIFKGYVELWDVRKERVEFPTGIKIFHSLGNKWDPDYVLIEDKDAGQQYIQMLRDPAEKYPYQNVIVKIDPEGLDKGTRMQAETSQLEKGIVRLPKSAPWLNAYLLELTLFTGNDAGGHDDQVDMTSQFLKWYRRKFKSSIVVGPSGDAPGSRHNID